jgi:hypothetical protein
VARRRAARLGAGGQRRRRERALPGADTCSFVDAGADTRLTTWGWRTALRR